MAKDTRSKVIITVAGKDAVGIIARICTYLSENGVNILDISQTIVDEFFHMMMVADLTGKETSFSRLQQELSEVGEQIGVEVHCQKAEIFEMMHRL